MISDCLNSKCLSVCLSINVSQKSIWPQIFGLLDIWSLKYLISQIFKSYDLQDFLSLWSTYDLSNLCKSDSKITNVLKLVSPSISLSVINSLECLLTIMPINHCAYWPLCLLTIVSINCHAYWPFCHRFSFRNF